MTGSLSALGRAPRQRSGVLAHRKTWLRLYSTRSSQSAINAWPFRIEAYRRGGAFLLTFGPSRTSGMASSEHSATASSAVRRRTLSGRHPRSSFRTRSAASSAGFISLPSTYPTVSFSPGTGVSSRRTGSWYSALSLNALACALRSS